MSKPIKFVYFDLGNVVLTFKEGLEKLAIKYDREFKDVKTIFLQYDDEICRGNMTPQDLWDKYQKKLHLSNELNFAEFWTDHLYPITETIALLNQLEKEKIPIGILSNIYPGIFELIKRKAIIPQFKWKNIVLSCEIGSVKPEEKIYKFAENIKCDPTNILFIDDNKKFLTPVLSRGWQTYQFDSFSPAKSVSDIKTLLNL